MTRGGGTRREDILVSVCFHELLQGAASADAIRRTAALLDSAYRYWEIVVVVPSDRLVLGERLKQLALEIRNLRILSVRGASRFYRRRAVAAAEAIGDVVVLTTGEEAPALDLLSLIEAAANGHAAVLCTRGAALRNSRTLAALGAASGFRVSSGQILTGAYPREWLNRLLAHPERELALRFPPRNEGFPVRWMAVPADQLAPRDLQQARRRLLLLYKLLVNASPNVLLGVALLSGLLTAAALAYAIYAVVVWLTFAEVQPGWFTTAIIQSMTAGFVGCALLGLSMGMQKILDRLEPDLDDVVVDETTSLDLFSEVRDLNVDVPGRPSQGGAAEVPESETVALERALGARL